MRSRLSFSLGQYATYSRKNCVISGRVQLRIYGVGIKIEASIFYQMVRQQLKPLAIARSILHCSGTATSPL
jgi:hypothetical protein